MALINTLISWIMKNRIHQMELFIRYPHDVQAEWLSRLLNEAQHTEWGKKYDFRSIENKETFKQRVPVQEYDDLKPYIDRMMKGEQNILWNSEIKWFAKSSGTTAGKSKFIPVSKEALEDCHYKGGKDMLCIYCNNMPETNLFSGRGLALGGSHQMVQFSNEAYYGDLSAIIIQNLPFWAEFIRTPDISIALMDEWETKLEKMAQVTLEQDVTSISGVPSWTLVLLRRILDISGKKTIREVWPNLELFMHGAVNFSPYKEHFQQTIGNPGIYYLETYNASEGFFGIQDQSNSSDMLLMLDYGIYYEFMPLDQLDKSHPKTLSLDEVELNINYALIITTNAGLWRYKIGDTIKFTSLNPFRIRITGRTKHFINAFGEEVIVDNAEKAITIACERTGATVKEFTACPVYFSGNQTGAHEWLIEFEKNPESMDFFADILDTALKSINSDYEAKRYKDFILEKPILRCLPSGTFYNWMKQRGKLGGQHKVPRLSNDREFVEEILALCRF